MRMWWWLLVEACVRGNFGTCGGDAENRVTLYTPIQCLYLPPSKLRCILDSGRKSKDTRRKCRGEPSEIPVHLQARWRVFNGITSTTRIVGRYSHYQENILQQIEVGYSI
jgi:hypothetical protein